MGVAERALQVFEILYFGFSMSYFPKSGFGGSDGLFSRDPRRDDSAGVFFRTTTGPNDKQPMEIPYGRDCSMNICQRNCLVPAC